MAFQACSFIFDGVPCSEHGLLIYDIGSATQGGGEFTSPVEVVEDRLSRKYAPIFYGTTQNEPLVFTVVFGADHNAIDKNKPLDRYDLDAISTWLTGVNDYRWLEIVQPDLEMVRYKCIISELEIIEYGWLPWAFQCTVQCDSPFGYTYPETYDFSVDGEATFNLLSRSSYKGYYYPKLEITLNNGSTDFSITNLTDNLNRVTCFEDVANPSTQTISMDNDNGVIVMGDDSNGYEKFKGYNFFRLVRGDNLIKVVGDCNIKIICEFPTNTGG